MRGVSVFAALVFLAAAPAAPAQTLTNLAALQGLAPASALLGTDTGKQALEANYQVTGAIQTGTANQPALQPFAAQQAQALRDSFITYLNATQLADGLGTRLGGAYQTLTPCRLENGKPVFTTISPRVTTLLIYSLVVAERDAGSAKHFFANATQQSHDGPAVPASPQAMAILESVGGTTDVFGKAYDHPAGSEGADPYGNSRPFQTEAHFLTYKDPDYFGYPSSNREWLEGAPPGTPRSLGMDLTKSPSFPSGHTVYGYTESLLLAIMVPQRYTQQITRAAEYGNSRIVVGAHYAMDVIGGRTLALYDLAQLLAEKPDYLNIKAGKLPSIGNYGAALAAARADLTTALHDATGQSLTAAAQDDTSRFADQAANEAFYESTQTYNLPVVYPAQAGRVEDVGKIAPEAGHLLTAAFPYLTLQQADDILTATEGPGGGFLDDGSAFGLYSRLDLYKAGLKAEAMIQKP